ncbi:MAG: orotate phosphoribosyltransferase [Candidatus Schekmanbacteria bacterium]|nr:orotate phosphoribosyltransferase [Candidatus Schekmanbacteria bacterium]
MTTTAVELAATRSRLLRIIIEKSVTRGREVRLASGKTSDLYIDMRRTVCDPTALALVAHLLLDAARRLAVDAVGGPATGGISLACATSLASLADGGAPLPWFYVRQSQKEHGAERQLEGADVFMKSVLVVEDVVTTGTSAAAAIDAARRSGAVVVGLVAVIDRKEGAGDLLSSMNVAFEPLFDRSDVAGESLP